MKLKSIFLLPLLLGSLNASAFELNVEQEKTVLGILNDVCGDTWCEGPFNITFTAVKFESTEGVYILKYEAEDIKKLNFSCKVQNAELIENIIQNPMGSENSQLYSVIDQCLQRDLLEQTLSAAGF